MPYRQPKSDKWFINRSFKGVGRVQRSTGTTNKKTADAMEAMLDRLYSSGKGQLVAAVAAGDLSLAWLFSLYTSRQIETHSTVLSLKPFSDIISWVADSPSFAKSTKVSYLSLAKKLDGLYPGSTVADMPEMIRRFRDYCQRQEPPINRGFNQTRTLLQSYATQIDGTYKPLWTEITNVKPIEYDIKTGTKLTYPQVREVMAKLFRFNKEMGIDAHPRIMWTLLLCGFRKSEYLSDWQVYEDRVVIRCGKRRQSKSVYRAVPLVTHQIALIHPMIPQLGFEVKLPYDPGTGFQGFERHLRDVSEHSISPHTFRHTYRTWLKLAGIPDERAERYMGHKVNDKDSSKLYSAYDPGPFLKSDAIAISAWLAKQESHYLENYNPHWGDFLEDQAEMNEAPPELIYQKVPQKRAPRPRRQGN